MSEENTVPVKCKSCCKPVGQGDSFRWNDYLDVLCRSCYNEIRSAAITFLSAQASIGCDPVVSHTVLNDMVNHPAHYKTGGIETIDFIRAKLGKQEFEAYCIGNVFKYLTRYRHKNGIEDLKKGQWYLNKAIESMQILEDVLDARD